MAKNLTVIPVSLNTSSGRFNLGCTSITLKSNIASRITRANPRDWAENFWIDGEVSLTGLVQENSVTDGMAAALPSFVDYITLCDGQQLYECRLKSVTVGPSSGVSGRGSDAFIGMTVTYSFLSYSAVTWLPDLVSANPVVSDGPVTNKGRWLTANGSRGYIGMADGSLNGFHLSQCSISSRYKNYMAPGLPTIIPVYEGSDISFSGIVDEPMLFMGAFELNYLSVIVPGTSGDLISKSAYNPLLRSQTISVSVGSGHPVMSYSMEFSGSLADLGGTNNGDWYYSA